MNRSSTQPPAVGNTVHRDVMSLLQIAGEIPQVIIDLSNVCRDEALGSASHKAVWDRFTRVMEAWCDGVESRPSAIAFADESLRRLFAPADRRQCQLAERSGLVRTIRGSADREILRWAQASGAAVLSADRFVGHRRRHPWIQGATDRFFGWTLQPSGHVRIVALEMGFAGAYTLSRGEETDMLKDRGIDPARPSDRELLSHAYRCANRYCMTALLSPDRLLVPPARQQRAPVCPGCKRQLEDLGPRPGAVEVVFEIGEREITRKVLENGGELTLGRGDLPKLRDADVNNALARVSRVHVSVRAERSMLRVCDLESRNGTSIARWNSVVRRFEEPVPLAAGRTVELGHRDIAILAGVLRLRRSGQRFAVGAGAAGAAGSRTRAKTTTTEAEDPS